MELAGGSASELCGLGLEVADGLFVPRAATTSKNSSGGGSRKRRRRRPPEPEPEPDTTAAVVTGWSSDDADDTPTGHRRPAPQLQSSHAILRPPEASCSQHSAKPPDIAPGLLPPEPAHPDDVLGDFGSDDSEAATGEPRDPAGSSARNSQQPRGFAVSMLNQLVTPPSPAKSPGSRNQLVDSALKQKKLLRGGLAQTLRKALQVHDSELTFWKHNFGVTAGVPKDGSFVSEVASCQRVARHFVIGCSRKGKLGILVSDRLFPTGVEVGATVLVAAPWKRVELHNGVGLVIATDFVTVISQEHATAQLRQALPVASSLKAAPPSTSPYRVMRPQVLFGGSQEEPNSLDVPVVPRILSDPVHEISTLRPLQHHVSLAVRLQKRISQNEVQLVLCDGADTFVVEDTSGCFALLVIPEEHKSEILQQGVALVCRGLRVQREITSMEAPSLLQVTEGIRQCSGRQSGTGSRDRMLVVVADGREVTFSPQVSDDQVPTYALADFEELSASWSCSASSRGSEQERP